MRLKEVQGNKAVFADEKQEKKQQRQAKLAALAEKKKQGKLTLEDLDAKLDVVLEMLEELMPPK
jgi:hypothetical protein